MKTNLFCLVGLCLVIFTINYVASEEVHDKPFAVEAFDLTANHPGIDKSHYRGTKKLPAGGYLAFHEKGPFSLWFSIYSKSHDIDIMIMKDADYKSWIHGNRNPHFIERFSHIRVRDKEASSATVLDSGDYWIVLYNNKNYNNKFTTVDYDVRFQETSKGLQVWVVVLLSVGLALLLGVCLVASLLYGMRTGTSWYGSDREWWGDQTEGYQTKTTWKVSASKGIHDPERQPLNQ